MTWDAQRLRQPRGDAASPRPATTWYLAEGATHSGFDLFYLLQNPNGSAATRDGHLPAAGAGGADRQDLHGGRRTARFNIWVDSEGRGAGRPPTSRRSITADGVPIIVERAMYLEPAGQPFGAGHESAGVTAPATSWFLAEGATGPFFDLFVLIANPNGVAARRSTATYLLPDGQTVAQDVHRRRPTAASTSGSTSRSARARRHGGVDDDHVDQRRADHRRAGDVVARRRGALVRGAQLAGRDDDRHAVGAGRRRGRRRRTPPRPTC